MDLLERDDALAALEAAWAGAARGRGRAVIVSGEPGIGKTALIARFVRELAPGSRILLGACDDLSTPRPLGAIRDVVGAAAPALRMALETGAPAHEIHGLLIAELERAPRPTLLAIEDVHWADDATLDAISVIGRRIGSLPAVLVVTLRGGEVAPDHPLRAALASIRPGDAVDLELRPLSPDGVATLAGRLEAAGIDIAAVHRQTGGNPFYVTEVLATPSTTGLPPSVAKVVLARASRLDPASRELLELASVVPGRVSTALLDQLRPGWPASAEEPERRQLLDVDTRYVRFRHELARHAIRSNVPSARQRRLHAEILAVLLVSDADPADIVHHAEAAGAEDVVAGHVLVAARRARALGSNRQAFAHYQRATEVLGDAPPAEQAAVLEELAAMAYLVARLDDGFSAIERAIGVFRALGDETGVARCTAVLSRLHWYAGDGDAALERAQEAVAILEPLGDSAELARAYATVSQLAMLAEEIDEAVAWGELALALAVRLGDDAIRVHAMINVGTARLLRDPDQSATLLEAHALADALGEHHEATRAIGNLAYTLMTWVRPVEAMAMARRALAYAEAHEVDSLARYLVLVIGRIRLRLGEWEAVEVVARRGLERDSGVAELLARTILTELAVRRGDPAAVGLVADLLARGQRTREPQRIEPALELATSMALFDGDPFPGDDLRALLARLRTPSHFRARTRAWLALSGLGVWPDEPAETPHGFLARGDWRGAADGFGAVGWAYDRGLALTLLDDEAALGEALDIGRVVGSPPLARRATERLRRLGFAVPRGRRPATRANAAGLTTREQEVLALLAAGLTNADIAERLVVSPRTAEHHVTAVLAKLGATTRREAVQRAAGIGLGTASGDALTTVSDA